MPFGGLLGGGMQQGNPFAEYKQMQANPFTRQIPGTELLGGMGQGMGNAGNMGPMGMDPTTQGGNDVATDFAGVPPGLPNLPESMQGFGFGQSAPEMNVNSQLQESLLQQLIQQLMSGGAAQNPADSLQGNPFNQQGFGGYY